LFLAEDIVKEAHARRVLDYQAIKAVPLAAILEKYHLLSELKRIGAQHVGCCPVHKGSNKKQFVCDLSKNLWHCFGDCSRGGSTIELVSELERIDTRAAVRLIGEWFAVGTRQSAAPVRRRRVMSDSSNQPTHRVYSAKRREGADKDDLFLIGSGWVFETKDKKRSGLNIILSAAPLGDRIVVFERDPEWEAAQQAKREAATNDVKFTKKK
jgi:hypothetical protein